MGNNCNTESESSSKYKSKTKSSSLTNDLVPKRKQTLSDFKRIKPLGQGGYGKVYLVLNQNDQSHYAMKTIDKKTLTKESTIKHIKDERRVMEKLKCQFLLKLKWAFQDDNYLYLIVQYMDGGELFYHLRNANVFPLPVAKFYASEILLGLKYLHENNIIYRDLKPENILLDSKGHIKLADFGLSKVLGSNDKAFSVCGTPEYLAPEVVTQKQGYTMSCDWYSYGCIIYEMLQGTPPFYNPKDKKKMIHDRIHKKLEFDKPIDKISKDFITKLTSLDPDQRLGSNGAQEVMNHPFFEGIEFEGIQYQESPYTFDHTSRFFDNGLKDMTINQKVAENFHPNQFTNFTYQASRNQVTVDISSVEDQMNKSNVSNIQQVKIFNQ